jgi:hypothetical protein
MLFRFLLVLNSHAVRLDTLISKNFQGLDQFDQNVMEINIGRKPLDP